ncbi:MAG TPA: hypothetical protein VJV77_16555 [Casimicrobiaceae bacterium]|nr:hypothetical protein [Casimicrobiaceae bacterium]
MSAHDVEAACIGRSFGDSLSVHATDPHAHLVALGADAFAHVSGSLARHLAETERILRSWNSRRALCLAGLYHAVYGTDGIRGSLAALDRRDAIVAIVGAEAEALAYLYGACAREIFHPRIGTSDQLRFADRFTASEYPISLASLRDFCELTVANELELAIASDAFRSEYAVELSAFFRRMEGLVSAECERTWRTVLAH